MSFLSQPITLQSLFGSKRMIDGITVQVVLSEETNDTLTITKQPVQTGASITDHAYKEPTVLSMNILQQNNSISAIFNPFDTGLGLSQIYGEFLALQNNRVPFTVTTPKRIYTNMLISVLRMNTDRRTENILSLSVSFQQIIIVNVSTTQVSPSQLKNAQVNQATQNAGQKQSGLYSGVQGFQKLVGK